MSGRGLELAWRYTTIVGLALLTAGCVALKRCAYEGVGRDGWQQPERVVESLEIEPGDQVADLGSGTGYFTFRLAQATGPEGRVYAVDVDTTLVEHLDEKAREEGHANVQGVIASFDDPKLEAASVDLLFTCNTYHHIEDRIAYFERVKKLLRPGGRVAIVELRPGWTYRFFPHATPPDDIRTEMESAGYRLVADHDWLSKQSFLIFAPVEG